MEEDKLEQNHREKPVSFSKKVALIGFIGGIFWSLLGYVSYLFKFTEISPNLVLISWAFGDWKYGVIGNFIGIFVIGLLSIGVAYVYSVTLKKINKLWPGLMFGIAMWVFVFYILNPFFPGLKSVGELELNTVITTICLYVLYGVFIGYSISYEHNELNLSNSVELSNNE